MSIRLALFIALCTLCAMPNGVAAADAGRIKVVSGAVHIERGGQRLPATVDAAVRATDTVVTGADGSVGIAFTDNTRISAGPNSVLVLNRYAFDQTTRAGAFDATLKRGTLAAVSGGIAKQSPQAMTVSTPTLILGVRGTEFLVFAE